MENKTLVIKQFANRIDAVQRIINWDTTNPDSKFYIEILEGNRVLYKSERDAFILKKYNDTLIHVSENENAAHTSTSAKNRFQKSDKLYSVAIYLDSSVHAHFLSDFRVQLLVIVFAVWAAIILSTYLGIRQGHKPIYILSKHMSSIQAERLSSTLEPGQYPRELRELVGSFNTMLSKLQNSFVKLSDFSDDVAHELRTPLTNIIMQAQVGLNQERSIPEYKEFLYSILEELEHLAKMVSDMLWIARSDKGLIYANKELLDIENELSSILDFFVYLAEEKT